MQQLNWNDLRYLLAIKRGGSLSCASNLMKVDATTVSRRLKVIGEILGEDIYVKQRDGSLKLTERGETIASHVETMEVEASHIDDLLGIISTGCTGKVRITSVPIIINHILIPSIGEFQKHHPDLHINLLPDSKNYRLNFREADIAIRLARPTEGGADTLAKRVGNFDYAVYASASLKSDQYEKLPWIGYDEEMSHLPTAMWINKTAKTTGENIANLKIHDNETALNAVQAGLGKTLLPIPVANQIQSIKPISNISVSVSRELWLLTHRSQSNTKRIVETIKWIESVMKTLAEPVNQMT